MICVYQIAINRVRKLVVKNYLVHFSVMFSHEIKINKE